MYKYLLDCLPDLDHPPIIRDSGCMYVSLFEKKKLFDLKAQSAKNGLILLGPLSDFQYVVAVDGR